MSWPALTAISWGASIIDTLDTMLIMGFNDEYNLCRPFINQLNFHWVNGRDWSRGYASVPEADGDDEETAVIWKVQRDAQTGLAVFESGIRYLGGLLGAYDVSGDQLLVDRAVELAGVLGKAFNTQSGLPAGRIDPGATGSFYRLQTVSLAEVGSMTLELVRLSQITKDRHWFDLAQRAMDYIEERVIPRGVYPPLIPMWFQPDSPLSVSMTGPLSVGALADSYYEYLIKAYQLLGGNAVAQQYRRIYDESVERIRQVLYADVTVVPGRDILALGKLEGGRLVPEIEHLTCFAGAMLGLGSKLLSKAQDMLDATRFTQSCYWLSAATPSGVQPDITEFYENETPEAFMHENVTLEGHLLHPIVEDVQVSSSIPNTYRDPQGVLRWREDGSEVETARGESVEYYARLKGIPPGANKVSKRYLNRPETIESVFYM
jgi:mannosyl-oligosaccharide alpha-1,2-mannosidase